MLKAQVLPALLAGTGRHPLHVTAELDDVIRPGDPKGALHALSLTAQALRFERPLPPPNFATEATIKDERAIIPEHLRRPLLRVFNGKRSSDAAALTLAWEFAKLRLRPHPFDLPRLDAFVRAHAEHLGVTAQHWVRYQAEQRAGAATQPRGYFDADEINEANWTDAPPAPRARFLQERRGQDAAAARALLESVWAQEDADARFALLAALQCGLSAEDQPFLEGLAKDRAPRVRALSQRLLARLPGQAGENPAMQECLSRIQRTSAGLLKRHALLKLELPATVKDHEAAAWISGAFAEVGFDELARALGLSEEEMIEAAAKDESLLLACALMMTRDRRLDLLEILVSRYLPNAGELMARCGLPDIALMQPQERMQWAEILIRPYTHATLPGYLAWSWIHRALEGPMPESMMEQLLRSAGWEELLQDPKKLIPEWIEIIAGLCPAAQRNHLRCRIAVLDPALTAVTLPLLDILDAMENAKL